MEFPKISNKTVRKNENYCATYFNKEGGTLQKTNRGYFLNGTHISVFSASAWLARYGVVVDGTYRPAKVHRKRVDPIKSYVPEWELDMRVAQQRRHAHRQAMRELASGSVQKPKGDW